MGMLQEVLNGFAHQFRDARRLGALLTTGKPQQAQLAQHVHRQRNGDLLEIATLTAGRMGLAP